MRLLLTVRLQGSHNMIASVPGSAHWDPRGTNRSGCSSAYACTRTNCACRGETLSSDPRIRSTLHQVHLRPRLAGKNHTISDGGTLTLAAAPNGGGANMRLCFIIEEQYRGDSMPL